MAEAEPAPGGEFVEGWLVAQVLGEGAYGEVRLLVNGATGACVALKTVRGADGCAAAAREAALHRALRHPHVLRCLGARAAPPHHYMFLQYAQGGELFDRIEPDRGMPARAARRYWRQLLRALRYLHRRGVAHRDVKPENVLLDADDDVKLADFGLATLFRHGARERLLARVCGTLPYAAPEVLRASADAPYRAPPADLWAAALVLLAMLAGELPWERAHPADARYAAWSAGAAAGGPWSKLSAGALALLGAALRPDAPRRADLDELLRHPWMSEDDELPEHPPAGGAARAWCSQPAARVDDFTSGADAALAALLVHSQPAAPRDLLLSQGTQGTQPTQGTVVARLVRRMTRVWVRGDERAALSALAAALDALGLAWRRLPYSPHLLAVDCGGDVRMRAWAVRARPADDADAPDSGLTLLEFRRSRGCGLAFKRRFLQLRAALAPLAAPAPAGPGADLVAPPLARGPAREPMDTGED